MNIGTRIVNAITGRLGTIVAHTRAGLYVWVHFDGEHEDTRVPLDALDRVQA